jgi:hypothetical protein
MGCSEIGICQDWLGRNENKSGSVAAMRKCKNIPKELAPALVYKCRDIDLRNSMITRRHLVLTSLLVATEAPLARAEPAGWKIDDIKGTSDGEAWSIRAMLGDSLKS